MSRIHLARQGRFQPARGRAPEVLDRPRPLVVQALLRQLALQDGQEEAK